MREPETLSRFNLTQRAADSADNAIHEHGEPRIHADSADSRAREPRIHADDADLRSREPRIPRTTRIHA